MSDHTSPCEIIGSPLLARIRFLKFVYT